MAPHLFQNRAAFSCSVSSGNWRQRSRLGRQDLGRARGRAREGQRRTKWAENQKNEHSENIRSALRFQGGRRHERLAQTEPRVLAGPDYKGWALLESCMIKGQAPRTGPGHHKHDRSSIPRSPAEVGSPFTRGPVKPLQRRLMRGVAWRRGVRLLGKRDFLRGRSGRPDQMRQALVSADCYGPLTYTRWKGSPLLRRS